MLPDDQQTVEQARVVNPKYGARMERLAALAAAMPTGVTADLNDETINAIAAGLERRKQGTR